MIYLWCIMKTCSKCGEEKDLIYFVVRNDKPTSRCKQCNNKYAKQYRINNPDKIKKLNNKAYIENSNRIIKCTRQYYKDNREKILKKCKKKYKDNREEMLKKGRRYSKENSDRIKQYSKDYRIDLKDGYVASLINNSCKNLKSKDIPQELIEMKRIEVQMRRALKDLE